MHEYKGLSPKFACGFRIGFGAVLISSASHAALVRACVLASNWKGRLALLLDKIAKQRCIKRFYNSRSRGACIAWGSGFMILYTHNLDLISESLCVFVVAMNTLWVCTERVCFWGL